MEDKNRKPIKVNRKSRVTLGSDNESLRRTVDLQYKKIKEMEKVLNDNATHLNESVSNLTDRLNTIRERCRRLESLATDGQGVVDYKFAKRLTDIEMRVNQHIPPATKTSST